MEWTISFHDFKVITRWGGKPWDISILILRILFKWNIYVDYSYSWRAYITYRQSSFPRWVTGLSERWVSSPFDWRKLSLRKKKHFNDLQVFINWQCNKIFEFLSLGEKELVDTYMFYSNKIPHLRITFGRGKGGCVGCHLSPSSLRTNLSSAMAAANFKLIQVCNYKLEIMNSKSNILSKMIPFEMFQNVRLIKDFFRIYFSPF